MATSWDETSRRPTRRVARQLWSMRGTGRDLGLGGMIYKHLGSEHKRESVSKNQVSSHRVSAFC